MTMVAIKVLFFASLREQIGMSELEVKAKNLSGLMQALADTLSVDGMAHLRAENVRIAVNHNLLEGEDCVFSPGDEVAFLPPVTGG